MFTPPNSPRSLALSQTNSSILSADKNNPTKNDQPAHSPPSETRYAPRQITLLTSLPAEMLDHILFYATPGDPGLPGRLAQVSSDLSAEVANTHQYYLAKVDANIAAFKKLPMQERSPQLLTDPDKGFVPAEWQPKIETVVQAAIHKLDGKFYLEYLCSNEMADLLLRLHLTGQEPDWQAYLNVPACLIPRVHISETSCGHVSIETEERVKRGLIGLIQRHHIPLDQEGRQTALDNMLASQLFSFSRFKKPHWFYVLELLDHHDPAYRLSLEQIRKIIATWPKDLYPAVEQDRVHSPLTEAVALHLEKQYDVELIQTVLDAGQTALIDRALSMAIMRNSSDVFNRLVKAADLADIDHIPLPDYEGASIRATVLDVAVRSGQPAYAEALLKKGTFARTLEWRNKNGHTPLKVALDLAQSRDAAKSQAGTEMVSHLVKAGAEIDRSHLVETSRPEVLKILLTGKNAQQAVVQLDQYGDSALSAHARGDNLEIIRLLLEAGADKVINAVSRYHGQALYNAVERGNIAMFRLLTEYGATPTGEHSTDSSRDGHAWLMLLALSKGSPHPQSLSAEEHLEMARVILAHAPFNDPTWWQNQQSRHHSRPPHSAAMTALPFCKSYPGATAVAELLLDRGADFGINWIGDSGNTPLHWAVDHAVSGFDNGQLIDLLLRKGAGASVMQLGLERKSNVLQTPLHRVIETKRRDLLKLLLPYCSPQAITHEFSGAPSLLKAAVQTGDFALVKMLIEVAGPERLTQPDSTGKNALQWARDFGFSDLSTQLQKLTVPYSRH